MRALRNANFKKIKISSAIDKEQQIQKLNTILVKEQGMKKIIAKDNIEAYFIKRTRTRTFRKSGPQILIKSGPSTKVHCMS